MVGLEELRGEELFLTPSDPVVIELNRLQNQLKEKDQELGLAHGEIKALKAIDILKDKAVEELSNKLEKLDEKLRDTENLLQHKNLEIKKLRNDKKEVLAAQFAAEATLRRLHANQKDDDSVPLEAVIAPLEADIKMYKKEIAALQEDYKALERLSKSKESALVEAQRILRSALERVLIVEEVQNQNLELKRQIEIFQEENRNLDKTNRQKVAEVEKLSKTIQELEESILAGGAAANAVRDSQRQVSELYDENKTLERELARVKVSANRVAVVVANEWKDDNDKVMPVKRWLEERRYFQAEIQRLRNKLVLSENTAKAEAHLKDKLRLRLKTIEGGLKHVSNITVNTSASCELQKLDNSNQSLGFLSNNTGLGKRSTSQPRASVTISKSSLLQQKNLVTRTISASGQLKGASTLKMKYFSGENTRRSLWVPNKELSDNGGKENTEVNANSEVNAKKLIDGEEVVSGENRSKGDNDMGLQNKGSLCAGSEDLVSGFLYDRLQREVINLRKSCEEKDAILNAKDEETKMLMKKVDALAKAMEIELKKRKREAASAKVEGQQTKDQKHKLF
ncbi:microtubule-associated protein 70-5 isoform X2 [Telopea speciosissima]|uniref:microtubule-associated protein 70-5 isoform X1 n=1 Tax=Telopea speciosissima TaxID=54955 RepID=UPI001CC42F30|nr:microtubule-associated protein 70-5 isoform X1 [Telopea speciosissima]XP_043692467.1 microtubule-associated protein 70-5 isoform X2 [Telopea speciosissima]